MQVGDLDVGCSILKYFSHVWTSTHCLRLAHKNLHGILPELARVVHQGRVLLEQHIFAATPNDLEAAIRLQQALRDPAALRDKVSDSFRVAPDNYYRAYGLHMEHTADAYMCQAYENVMTWAAGIRDAGFSESEAAVICNDQRAD